MPYTMNPFDEDVNDNSIDRCWEGCHGMTPESFPASLSSWMIADASRPSPNPPGEEVDDDATCYHDCLSDAMDDLSSSSSVDDETTSLIPRTAQRHEITSQSRSPLRQISNFYNATSTTPIRRNSSVLQNGPAHFVSPQNEPVLSGIVSPLAHALATWLAPYADSAKRAGRTIMFSPEGTAADEETQSIAGGNSNRLLTNGRDNSTGDALHEVRFRSDFKDAAVSYLSRVCSSPALMTTLADERHSTIRNLSDYSTIVLKDIDVQGENNDFEDGTVMHPWTKLILLEELGTAWSWFVLLLPYVFLILAIYLDGNTRLRNTVVGPLHGKSTCAEIVGGSVPTPFDESVKGYFPVPFRFSDDKKLRCSCTYPFELRDGVGLLFDGKSGSNSTLSRMAIERTTIITPRYRYLMSHGYAFTSGVISNVPPTSQSLSGTLNVNKLSSGAVALVARGSVLVSAIIFQRPSPDDDVASNKTMEYGFWSPVLILSSKRLEMICTLNGNPNETANDARTWNCISSHIIEAFFSLPNTAVLMGGDMRVEILLSYQKSPIENLWFHERDGIIGTHDDYIVRDVNEDFDLSEAEKILSSADVSRPQELLAELSTKSEYKIEHESIAYNNIVEATRMISLALTIVFICYWIWSMGVFNENSDADSGDGYDRDAISGRIRSCANALFRSLFCSRRRKSNKQSYLFWWQDPWIAFPERRYLLLLLFCLVILQNPLLAMAWFNPSLYELPEFRFIADSLSSISVHGILFLWLCLVHGLRYHTADIARRRFDQHRRVLELLKATKHISPIDDVDDDEWGQVKRYYQQYGDVDGGGTSYSMGLRMNHDFKSDSIIDFILPKISLLVLGIAASITAAASRFPMYESSSMSEREELNPDRLGNASKVYVISSFVQIIVQIFVCLFIIYTSFVTGERLKREPFLSTRPAQLAFRVLSSILLLGLGFILALFYHSLNLIGILASKSENTADELSYDTSLRRNDESLESKAAILMNLIIQATAVIPYVGTASNIGPGKILYATACSLVVAYMFLPSSCFHSSPQNGSRHGRPPASSSEDISIEPTQYSKQTVLSDLDKRYQGKDKRSVVTLARNTHTWRIFPLPTRSHVYLSQHTIKETLNIIGTFQLRVDGRYFNMHKNKYGQGAIYKGRYSPVFCVELACWLLEASWQSYYSPSEYSLNQWAPGRMRLDSIGLKLEHVIHDSDTDTHGFVASNISEQVEGEEDSVIVVAFRGSASFSNLQTDFSFRQVPLPEQIMSDIPAFNIRPGKPIAVDETLWDESEIASSSILQEILRIPSGKYTTWPNIAGDTCEVDQVVLDQSLFIPAVATGAKAIIRATPLARQALPCVHEGFLRNYSKVRHEVIPAILNVFKRQLEKSVERSRRNGGSSSGHDTQPLTLPKLYITGHSMGGAIAQLLALDLASNCEILLSGGCPFKWSLSSQDFDDDADGIFWLGQKATHQSTNKIRLRPPIAVYTYGQPRLGNLAFKTIYKKRVPHTFRVSTEGDAVTAMVTFGAACEGTYRHAGMEVLLEEGCTGNILVGPTVVETLLRFTKVRTSMGAHSMDRYRESLESALGREELREYYRGHGGKVRYDHRDSLPSWVTSR